MPLRWTQHSQSQHSHLHTDAPHASDVVESEEAEEAGRTAGTGGGEGEDEDDGHDQVPGVKQKWKLLPHFLKLRGLMRQHIDSYDYFVNVDISKVGVCVSDVRQAVSFVDKVLLLFTWATDWLCTQII